MTHMSDTPKQCSASVVPVFEGYYQVYQLAKLDICLLQWAVSTHLAGEHSSQTRRDQDSIKPALPAPPTVYSTGRSRYWRAASK